MKLNPHKCLFGVGSGKFVGYIVNMRGIEKRLDKIRALLGMKSSIKVKEVQSLTGKVAIISRFISKSTDKCVPFFNLLKRNKKFEWREECDRVFQAVKEHLSQPPVLSKPIEGESLYIYLVVTNVIASAILVRQEDTVQKVAYYLSKRLVDAETRYPAIEKLTQNLVLASKKLRPYFQAHPIIVYTNQPIKPMIHYIETRVSKRPRLFSIS